MSSTEHLPLFSHSQELLIFYWETLSLHKHMILTEIQIEKSVQLIIQVANHLHGAWWHRRTLTVLNWNTPERTIDRPGENALRTDHRQGRSPLRSLWYIVSNEDTNFCIKHRHSNMGELGPAIYIVLWRHLLMWHWQRLLSEYSRQRNKHRLVETTNLQIGYSKTRGWHAVSIQGYEIDGGRFTTHTQVPHEMLCHESVTAPRIQKCLHTTFLVTKHRFHTNWNYWHSL